MDILSESIPALPLRAAAGGRTGRAATASGAIASRRADRSGADAAVVGPYLARVLDEPGWRDCTVEVIAGGRSNLTYW